MSDLLNYQGEMESLHLVPVLKNFNTGGMNDISPYINAYGGLCPKVSRQGVRDSADDKLL